MTDVEEEVIEVETIDEEGIQELQQELINPLSAGATQKDVTRYFKLLADQTEEDMARRKEMEEQEIPNTVPFDPEKIRKYHYYSDRFVGQVVENTICCPVCGNWGETIFWTEHMEHAHPDNFQKWEGRTEYD